MNYLFILNDPPYDTERSYNGLRLARACGMALDGCGIGEVGMIGGM